LADSNSASIGVQLLAQVDHHPSQVFHHVEQFISNHPLQAQQLLDGPLMRSSQRALFNAWAAFTKAHCFIFVERFESALSVLLQYSKLTDSNSVHDSCTVCIMLLM
jgi:hypothetical protein